MTFKALPQQNEPLYLQQIAHLYTKEGWSCGRIGGRYKRDTETIKADLMRAGVALREWGWHCVRDWTSDTPKIVALYKSDLTVREIAKQFSSTITTISNILKQEGIIPLTAPERRRSELDGHKSDIIKSYNEGETIQSLAKRYHISTPVLREMLESTGMKIRKSVDYDTSLTSRARNFRETKGIDIVKDYIEKGWSIKRIAERYGIYEGGISRILREAGIKIDPYRYSKPTQEEEKEMVRLYTTGNRIKDIQELTGYRFVTVRAALTKHGVLIRTHLQTSSRRFGYTGTYRHFVFRSLMELSFILDHEQDHYIESAESYRIVYWDGDRKRTYYPDFLLNHTCLVEVKPSSHLNDERVVAKAKAAQEYCRGKGWNYVITDWPIDKNRIGRLVKTGIVRITNRTLEEVASHLGFTHDI